MKLTHITTKCSGLEVMAPVPIQTSNNNQIDEAFYLNNDIIN